MVITFIGGGNMASALIGGLVKSGGDDLQVRVADPSEDVRAAAQARFGAKVFANNADAADGADVVVLAVKPQVMAVVLDSVAPGLEPGQLVISVAAGTTVASMERVLGRGVAVVRAMPNTPALIGLGITGLHAGSECRPHHRELAEKVLRSVGEVVWVDDEALMDVVTAVSGSGPAYYFLFTEALANAGAALGLERATADRLALHTARGACVMAAESEVDICELRHRVTSPGGTTEAAVGEFETRHLRDIVHEAVAAAFLRGQALANSGGDR
jgi:pyrroline-5-carboxylate reductase